MPDQTPSAFQILTGPGPAAIAVLRIVGPKTAAFVSRHLRTGRPPARWRAGQILRTDLLDADREPIDDGLLSIHADPPVWDLRLHLHGSPWLVRTTAAFLERAGLTRQRETAPDLWPGATPIEAAAFAQMPRMLTLAGVAWLSRQITLLPAALRSIYALRSLERMRARLRAIRARGSIHSWFANPLRVAVLGPPNAGKSTLVNALAAEQVAVVSPAPGTTRDWVEVPSDIDGFPVVWLDTAGLRAGRDPIETDGVRRAEAWAVRAAQRVIVLDATPAAAAARLEFIQRYASLRPACVVLNKGDLLDDRTAALFGLPASWRAVAVSASAAQRSGLEALRAAVIARSGRDAGELDDPAAVDERQAALLTDALARKDRPSLTERLHAGFGLSQ